MPPYSFGLESPLKFNIPDKMAEDYNAAVAEFFKAQQRFNQKFGRRWDPVSEPIKIKWSKSQRKAWNDFSKIFNKVNEEQGPFHINDIMDDFLVKNVVPEVVGALGKFGQVIRFAAGSGALYGLLRGR